MAAHFIVECLDCGYSTPYFPTSVSCPRCGSGWREALYDYASLALSLPLQLPGRPFDVWRYKELLPVRDHNPDFSLGEGGTPLIRANSLDTMLSCPNLFIKDERQNPSATYDDRQAAVTVAALIESGINEMVVASTGAIALAYAAHGARGGIKVWAFLSSLVPENITHEINLYGGRVIKIAGSYEQTRLIALEFSRQRNIFMDQSAQTVPSIEALKTIAYETTEQITAYMGAPASKVKNKPGMAWRAPDWYIQSVSIGLGPLGVMKGFSELRLMGLIDRAPALGLIQPEGCAPMVRAYNHNLDAVEPLYTSDTSINSLICIDPGRAYTLLRHRMEQESGGVFESVTDREAYKALNLVARLEGISIEPAAGVAFAGLIKLCNKGLIKEKDVVVVNCSGHSFQVEPFHKAANIDRRKHTSPFSNPQAEGLLGLLNMVDLHDYQKILVGVSDEKLSNIIRLFFELRGKVTLITANEQRKTVRIAQAEVPDLIILDLFSAEINGFAVLDSLFAKNSQPIIPTIGILSADLPDLEKLQLDAYLDEYAKGQPVPNNLIIDELKKLIH